MIFEHFDQSDIRTIFRVQCTQQLPVPYPSSKRYMKCKYKANWKVDGELFCTRHAGIRALSELTGVRHFKIGDGE